MDPYKDAKTNSRISFSPDTTQDENERRLFHLKTLYDVSQELLGVVEIKTILKSFLLMTLGNFGVVEGIILIHDPHSREQGQLVTMGIHEFDSTTLLEEGVNFLANDAPGNGIMTDKARRQLKFLPHEIDCVVCFYVDEDCIGLLGLGSKIVGDPYSNEDRDLLETMVNNLIVSLKNARSAEALQNAYEELAVLNRAKDKLIHHLAHELQTPLAVLKSSLALLQRKLSSLPEKDWQRTIQRANRHIQRLADMQLEVEDILKNPETETYNILSRLIDQCGDQLEILLAEQIGETSAIDRIKKRIEEIYGPRETAAQDIQLDQFVNAQIEQMQPLHSHRQLELVIDTERTPPVRIPPEVLEKLIIGLVKNAIENTPDEGKIEVAVRKMAGGAALKVHDFGVGITEAHRRRIFEGFFPTQETHTYSSKNPYDFNAGGKGADLLRLKIFSERFHFNLDVASVRCRHIPLATDICPGKISQCQHCQRIEDCYFSGETTFTVVFQSP